MEQHPVPQNITSFEFRLIGDMTLKQFGFLAGGAILAFTIWQLPLPGLIRIPIAAILAFSGIAFAFLPLEDRPLHRWFLAFVKSIYSPTQYLFQKSEVPPFFLTPDFLTATQKAAPAFHVQESRQKLEEYLKTLPKNLPTTLDNQEASSLKRVQALLKTAAALPSHRRPLPNPPLVPLRLKQESKIELKKQTAPFPVAEEKPQPPPQKRLSFAEGGRLIFEEERKTIPTIPFAPEKIASRSEVLVDQIKRLRDEISALQKGKPSAKTPSGETVNYEQHLTSLEEQLAEAEREKENLMKAMLRLQKEMREKPKGKEAEEVLEKSYTTKIISAQAAKEVGLPKLTSTPNVITGVIQNRRGSFLPNILVEVKDAKGNSVRAFKTNKLGQFAAATPLEKGTYTLEFEDPQDQFIFDIIELKVEDAVLPALAVYAKDQAGLEKEKIKTALFGN